LVAKMSSEDLAIWASDFFICACFSRIDDFMSSSDFLPVVLMKFF
jgi:hypothetical protein